MICYSGPEDSATYKQPRTRYGQWVGDSDSVFGVSALDDCRFIPADELAEEDWLCGEARQHELGTRLICTLADAHPHGAPLRAEVRGSRWDDLMGSGCADFPVYMVKMLCGSLDELPMQDAHGEHALWRVERPSAVSRSGRRVSPPPRHDSGSGSSSANSSPGDSPGDVPGSRQDHFHSGHRLTLQNARAIAGAEGLQEISHNRSSGVVSFRLRGSPARINVYYSTGTVGTCLGHPRQGKRQLFRRGCSTEGLRAIMRNPRLHTGRGYHRRDRRAPQPMGQLLEVAHAERQQQQQQQQRRRRRGGRDGQCRFCRSEAAAACANGCCGACCPDNGRLQCARHGC